MLLTDILETNARQFPHKPALVMRMGYRTVSLSYRQVHELAIRSARLLERLGVQPGDRLPLLAPNSPYWICLFWGALLRGAVLVPLNIQMTAAMVARVVEQTGARVLFKHRHFREPPPGLVVHDLELLPEDLAGLGAAGFTKAPAQETDLVQILYTSGTTGDPKGVMLTHRNLGANLEAIARVVPVAPTDRFLSILPLSHMFEQMAGFLVPFRAGATIAYAHSLPAIPELLREHRITKMAAVPEFLKLTLNKIEPRQPGPRQAFNALLRLADLAGMPAVQRLLFWPLHRRLGGRLRVIASGGAALDPELERKWNALGFTVLQGYGLTETSPVVTTNTEQSRRPGSVGRALPGVQARIAPDGEILVKGASVFQGYFRDPERTRAAFTDDGWYRTGDIGELDRDGYLYIRGRKKYMILGPGGQNVYPEDVETELAKVAGVRDACVLGLEKPNGQIEIHAVLLLKTEADNAAPVSPPDAGAIVAQANAHLASYQWIAGWTLWPQEDFPRSATRKVKREEVLNHLRRARDVEIPSHPVTPAGVLVQILAEIADTEAARITDATRIVPELNLDSLLRVELAARIEQRLGAVIDETQITATTTVAELHVLIKSAQVHPEAIRFKRWPLSAAATALRALSQSLLLFPLLRLFVQLRVEGRENLAALAAPVIFMPNHLSYLDSIVVAMALPPPWRRRLAFAAARDVLYQRFRLIVEVAELLFNAFPFPRREHEHIKAGLDYMGRLLDRGWSVVVYPEGRMSETGALQPLKRGAGLIATSMDCVVVPVKLAGTNRVVPYEKILPRRREVVTVTFGRPLRFSRRESADAVTAKIQEALQHL